VAKGVCVLSLSAGAGLWIMHREIGAVLFADRWHGIDRVIAFLGLFQGVSWIWAVCAEAYRAKGHAEVEPKSMLIALLYYVPVYLVTARMGMDAFLWGRLLVGAGSIALQAYFMPRYLNMSVAHFLRRLLPAMSAVAIMAVGVGILRVLLVPHIPALARLLICIIVALGLITWTIRLFERALFADVLVPLVAGLTKSKKILPA
jgi:hypothetical protein